MSLLIFFVAFFAFGICAVAQTKPEPNSGIKSLYDRELEFSRSCAAIGQHQTTYEALADDGILFRPGPIFAKTLLKSQSAPTVVLKTHPVFVDVSVSEDFGYVHGVYEFQTNMPLSEDFEYGFFCTLWEKDENKEWKVAIAQAISSGNKKPENIDLELSFPEGADNPGTYDSSISTESARKKLEAEDRLFSDEWRKAPNADTYMKYLASDAKIYRSGEIPASDNIKVKRLIESSGAYDWKLTGFGMAKSRDMGYTYGSFKSMSTKKTGYYMRVWKKQPDDSWKIVADVLKDP